MNTKLNITALSPAQQTLLEQALNAHNCAHLCTFSTTEGQEITTPIRLGQILNKIIKAHKNNTNEHLEIGTYTLSTAQNTLTMDENIIRLTDKESEILQILHAASSPIAREDLLHRIWGYAEGVETHTVETHIYRLRQKIEPDPAKPALLLTKEDGYTLRK